MKLKTRTWLILELARPGDRRSRLVDIFLLSLIFLNVLAVILESVNALATSYATAFLWFELFSVAVFTTEYLARVWACTSVMRFRHPILGRLRYMLTPMAIIDLLAILPFYLAFFGGDMRILRALRLFRLLRMAKLARYHRTLRHIGKVLSRKSEEMLLSVGVMLTLLVLAGSLMYYAENETQPEVFSSIPATMWWAVATLTTVGYGDVYPVTAMGRVLASIVAVLGIGVFALPTGILGAAFVEVVEEDRAKKLATGGACPTCGRVADGEHGHSGDGGGA